MCEDHGKRKLAYEIKQIPQGSLLHADVPRRGQVVPDLERVLRLDESVLRFLTILAEEEVADVEARKSAVASAAGRADQASAEERAVREAEEADRATRWPKKSASRARPRPKRLKAAEAARRGLPLNPVARRRSLHRRGVEDAAGESTEPAAPDG